MGTVLPLDLRRLLLQVGDVGAALFGVPLLVSLGQADCRPWLWEGFEEFCYDRQVCLK